MVPPHEKVMNGTAVGVCVAFAVCMGCIGILLAYFIYNGKITEANNRRMFMNAGAGGVMAKPM